MGAFGGVRDQRSLPRWAAGAVSGMAVVVGAAFRRRTWSAPGEASYDHPSRSNRPWLLLKRSPGRDGFVGNPEPRDTLGRGGALI